LESILHELSVTQNLLKLALRHADKNNASRILSMELVIGELSSVIDDSVSFYWDMISEGTIAEGAKLVFKRIPAKMECQDCGKIYLLVSGELSCPACEGAKITPIAGTEFLLNSIDVE